MKCCKVQFYLDPEDMEGLRTLVDAARENTLSQVLRNALSLYRAAVEVAEAGGKVQFVDKRGERSTVVFPGLGSR
jgi:hypothetical protein